MSLLDCPVGDPLTVPNLMLAEAAAADGVRTILNGEGGDPVFGGPKNLPMLIFELFRDDPDPEARRVCTSTATANATTISRHYSRRTLLPNSRVRHRSRMYWCRTCSRGG